MVRVNIGIRVTKGKEGKGMVHLGVWEWHKGTGRRGFKPGMSQKEWNKGLPEVFSGPLLKLTTRKKDSGFGVMQSDFARFWGLIEKHHEIVGIDEGEVEYFALYIQDIKWKARILNGGGEDENNSL